MGEKHRSTLGPLRSNIFYVFSSLRDIFQIQDMSQLKAEHKVNTMATALVSMVTLKVLLVTLVTAVSVLTCSNLY